MGEKGNFTGDQTKLPGVPRLGSASEAGFGKEPSADWGKGPADQNWGKPSDAGFDRGGQDWAKGAGGGQQLGQSVPPPQGGYGAPPAPQGPPPGMPPIGGFVAGRDRDDAQPQGHQQGPPPDGYQGYPPQQPPAR